MKQHEIDLIVERVTERVVVRLDGLLRPELNGIQASLERLQSTREGTKSDKETSSLLEASNLLQSTTQHLLEALQGVSLLDQVDELKTLLDRLGFTIVQKD